MTTPFRAFTGRTACRFTPGASVRCNGVWHELHSDGRWQDYGYCAHNPLPLYARRDGWIAVEVVDDVHGEGVEVLDPDGDRRLFVHGDALGPSLSSFRPGNSPAAWLDGYLTRHLEGCEPQYRGACSDHAYPFGCPPSQHRSAGGAIPPPSIPPGPSGWPPSVRPGINLEPVAGTVATPAEAAALGAPVARRLDRPTCRPGLDAGTTAAILGDIADRLDHDHPGDAGALTVAVLLRATAEHLDRLPALRDRLAALHMWAERAVSLGADPSIPGGGDVAGVLAQLWAQLPTGAGS